MNKGKILIALTAVIFLAAAAFAQETPFLTDDEIRLLTNEISGDRAFEHIRVLSRWHRDSGMTGYFKSVDYIVEQAKAAGLSDVKFIEQPMGQDAYNAISAELWMVEPVEVKLADIGDHALYLSDYSSDADLTAELVWIGDASEEALEGVDVEGKIVLTSAYPFLAVRNAVWERGAAGVVCYPLSEGKNAMDYPDQIAWTRIPTQGPQGSKDTFSFCLPPRKGDMLRQVLVAEGLQDVFATGKASPGGKVILKAKVDTEFKPGRTGFVEGWIRGKSRGGRQIVITAHLQEEQGSANDDGSGCANLLEIARVFNKLIEEGRIERPDRDIRFWWTDEIYSEYRYFMDHPEEPAKFLANLHQDMVGARQSFGSRVQHLIYAPHSITSYLDTMLESVGTFVINSNTAFLAPSRARGLPRPFTRPIYSTRGSREGFQAAFVPYFGQSDYMCFVEGAIGVPAIALINWDDPYIHSSDDDLWQIDQTQLARNAFIIASMALVLGRAEAGDLPLFAAETYAHGVRRLGNDLAAATRLIRDGSGEQNGWKDARIIAEQSVLREIRALESIRVFAGGDAPAEVLLDEFIAKMKGKREPMLAELAALYREVHDSDVPDINLSDAERAAAEKVPVNAPDLETYFSQRNNARFDGNLGGLMRFEVRNFIDGERSYYDIYKAVRAESLSVGEWYYGPVEFGDVVGYLDALAATDAVSIK